MENENSERKNRVTDGLFSKFFFAFFVLIIAYSCIDQNTNWFKPDYSQPHEYMLITGYGQNWQSIENNDHPFVFFGNTLLDNRDNYFQIGSGDCTKHLRSITVEEANNALESYNSFLNDEGDYNDVRIAHVELQCVEFLGRDKACEERLIKLLENTSDIKIVQYIYLEEMEKCDNKKFVGQVRRISREKQKVH